MKMRLLLLAPLLGGAIALAACDPSNLPQITEQSVASKIKTVQNYTASACSIIPTVGTLASLLTKWAAPLTSLADAICGAVTTAPLADGPGDHLPRVNGIVIKYTRVK